jgi:hypothetical protein
MITKSSVKARIEKDYLIIVMDKKIDDLRREIWKTIFRVKGELPDCDIAMTLGLIQYELMHHRRENDD